VTVAIYKKNSEDLNDTEKIRYFLNLIPFPAITVDSQQVVREHNEKARQLFGEMIEGKGILDFLNNFNLSQILFDTLIMRGKWKSTTLKFRGCTFYVVTSPLISGQITERVLVSFIDISKIYIPFVATKEAKEHFETIVNSFPCGIAVLNRERRFVYANHLLTEIVGFRPENIVGKTIDDLYNYGILLYPSVIEEAFLRKCAVEGIDRIYNGEEVYIKAIPKVSKHGCVEKITVFLEKKKVEKKKTNKRILFQGVPCFSVDSQKEADLFNCAHIITRNKKMISVMETMKRVAQTEVPVLLCGETGVGKGVFANYIHMLSGRSGAFLKINCNALPPELVETELFGYEEGAFTGARKKGKIGLFEMAEGGTLFLDEIGDMPISSQGKLLDFLDDRKIRRIGGTTDIYVNVRLIAATNKDLGLLVKEGKFRSDLYYRLNVLTIFIPPLRDRKEDIPILLSYYLNKFNKKYGCSKRFSSDSLERLTAYEWPGNVRELVNLVENMVVTVQEDIIQIADLPPQVKASQIRKPCPSKNGTLKEFVEKLERDILRSALREHKSSREIAKLLGTSHTTVLKKIKRYGLSPHGHR